MSSISTKLLSIVVSYADIFAANCLVSNHNWNSQEFNLVAHLITRKLGTTSQSLGSVLDSTCFFNLLATPLLSASNSIALLALLGITWNLVFEVPPIEDGI